jgi:hypothetical protein
VLLPPFSTNSMVATIPFPTETHLRCFRPTLLTEWTFSTPTDSLDSV